jgi:SAM-dependent methyltransferase
MQPHDDSTASAWVQRFAHLIGENARVLDLAAGHGRHARFFAARGACVTAVDRDAEALSALSGIPGIETRIADLESGEWPFRTAKFDGVVVTHYLHRPLFAHLLSSLDDTGVLLYETFAEGNERFGRPRNPDFLLQRSELLDIARTLTVVAFEQGYVVGERSAVVQRLAAVGRRYPWPPPLSLAHASRGGIG